MQPNHLLGYDRLEVQSNGERVCWFITPNKPSWASLPFDLDALMAHEIQRRDPFCNQPIGTLDHKRRQ